MCGIYFIQRFPGSLLSDSEVLKRAYDGLVDLQHRGREGHGMGSLDSKSGHFVVTRSEEPISRFADLTRFEIQAKFGHHAGGTILCQARYATTGRISNDNAQPMIDEDIMMVFNGNIANWHELKAEIETEDPRPFSQGEDSISDTEILTRYINLCRKKAKTELVAGGKTPSAREIYQEAFRKVDKAIDGACSLVLQDTQGYIVAYRERLGFKPITMRVSETDGILELASETNALKGKHRGRTLTAGHIAFLDPKTMTRMDIISIDQKDRDYPTKENGRVKISKCVMEHVYFGNVVSLRSGQTNRVTRHKLGVSLGDQIKSQLEQRTINSSNSVVIGVPNTALPYAQGLAEALGFRYDASAILTNGTTRGFINKDPDRRQEVRDGKYAYDLSEHRGKNVILVDDSLFRGETSTDIIRRVKEYHPARVFFAVGSPMVVGNCFYGTAIPTLDELAVYNALTKLAPTHRKHVLEKVSQGEDVTAFEPLLIQMAMDLGLDPEAGEGLFFINHENFIKGLPMKNMCTGCLMGLYPTPAGTNEFRNPFTHMQKTLG